MGLTRKQFCAGLGGGTVLLFISSCGGGGDSGATTTPPVSAGCHDTLITGNHGHVLAIPTADLTSTVDKTYSIQGTAAHDHLIMLTVAQLGQLKAGTTVTVTSTTGATHTHDVTASCA